MLQLKVYIESRKRFSLEDITKILDFLNNNFKLSKDIEEVYTKQRCAIHGKEKE